MSRRKTIRAPSSTARATRCTRGGKIRSRAECLGNATPCERQGARARIGAVGDQRELLQVRPADGVEPGPLEIGRDVPRGDLRLRAQRHAPRQRFGRQEVEIGAKARLPRTGVRRLAEQSRDGTESGYARNRQTHAYTGTVRSASATVG